MLTITIPPVSGWDEVNEEFVTLKGQTLQLEHSLVSLHKWEQIRHKPFLETLGKGMSHEEVIDYIKCMTLTQNVDPMVYQRITKEHIAQINSYMENQMTATWFNNDNNAKRPKREIVTAEIIYYWMIGYNIPFECRKWHLNTLLTLIQVCDRKNAKPKKMSQNDIRSRHAAINAANKKRFNTKG